MFGIFSPLKRKSMMVNIDKDGMDHLERAEKKSMQIFKRSAKRMGTIMAMEMYLDKVNIDDIDEIAERYDRLETEENNDSTMSIKGRGTFLSKGSKGKKDSDNEVEESFLDSKRRRKRLMTIEALRRQTVLQKRKTLLMDNNMLDSMDEFDIYSDVDEEEVDFSRNTHQFSSWNTPNLSRRQSTLNYHQGSIRKDSNFSKNSKIEKNNKPKPKESAFSQVLSGGGMGLLTSKVPSFNLASKFKYDPNAKDKDGNPIKPTQLQKFGGNFLKMGGHLSSGLGKLEKTCSINPEGSFKLAWDHFQMMLILYVATLTPFKFSFIEDGDFPTWEKIDYVIDFFFTVDIVITFFTPIKVKGVYVYSKWKIFVNYAKTTLFFDIISVIPLDLILGSTNTGGAGSVTKLAKFAKAPRITKALRVTKLLRTLRMSNKQDTIFAKVVLYFSRSDLLFISIVPIYLMSMIVAQIFCCVWHLIARTSSDATNWLHYYQYEFEPTHDRFWASLYYVYSTFTTTGYGDIVPHTNIEFLVTIIMMMLGVLFYSYLYTTIINKFEKQNAKNKFFTDKLEEL